MLNRLSFSQTNIEGELPDIVTGYKIEQFFKLLCIIT